MGILVMFVICFGNAFGVFGWCLYDFCKCCGDVLCEFGLCLGLSGIFLMASEKRFAPNAKVLW